MIHKEDKNKNTLNNRWNPYMGWNWILPCKNTSRFLYWVCYVFNCMRSIKHSIPVSKACNNLTSCTRLHLKSCPRVGTPPRSGHLPSILLINCMRNYVYTLEVGWHILLSILWWTFDTDTVQTSCFMIETFKRYLDLWDRETDITCHLSFLHGGQF